jgi:uncharacterized repeat protein (TIGR01451 family)
VDPTTLVATTVFPRFRRRFARNALKGRTRNNWILTLWLAVLSTLNLSGAEIAIHYSYDSLNRLVEVRYPHSTVQYTYDAAGNRLSMVVTGFPDLKLTKSHEGVFPVGRTGVFTLQVENEGAAPAPGPITVTDNLPSGLQFVSGVGEGWNCEAAGQAVACTRAEGLAAGASSSLQITVQVNVSGQLVNTALVSGAGDVDPSDNEATDTVDAVACSYSLGSSSATAPDTGGTGSVDLTADSGCPWTAASNDPWITITTAGSGYGNAGIGYQVEANTGAAREGALTIAGLTFVITQAAAYVAPRSADLSVVKSHSGSFFVGQQAVYLIAVANAGPDATNKQLTLTDVLPTGLSYVSGAGTGWSCGCSEQAVTCTRDEALAAGTSTTVALTVNVLAAAAPSISNTATVAYEGDSASADNASTDTATVMSTDVSGNWTVGGYLGVGTETPQRAIHLRGSNAVFRMDRSLDTAAFLLVRTDELANPLKTFVVGVNASGPNQGEFIINDIGAAVGGGGLRRMSILNGGETVFNGSLTAANFFTPSSLSLKNRVSSLEDPVTKIGQLNGVLFNRRDARFPSVGMLAEEVAPVLPELVSWEPGGKVLRGLNYDGLVALLLESSKAQVRELGALRIKREQLIRLLEQLEKANQELEKGSRQ